MGRPSAMTSPFILQKSTINELLLQVIHET
jgi:hypothetical protein